MVDVFENAVSVRIHDKDVQSIKTIDGVVIWEKERISSSLLYAEFTSNPTFGMQGTPWNYGALEIDWGDGTSDSVPSLHDSPVSHNYMDSLEKHTVIIDGNMNHIRRYMFAGNGGLVAINIPSTTTIIDVDSFSQCLYLSKYILNWESDPIAFNSAIYRIMSNTIFEIPHGTTQIYVDAGYPADKLIERSE